GACAISHDRLDDWIYHAQVFGLHLLSLDIRQDARVHREVMTELLKKAGMSEDWGALPEAQRVETLVATLDQPIHAETLDLSPVARDALATFDVMVRAVMEFGPRCIGGHVISMTREASDVMAVLW